MGTDDVDAFRRLPDDKVSRQPWRSCTSTVVIIESGRFFLSNNVIQVFPFEILGRAGKEILSSGLVEVDHGSVCRYSSRRRGRSRATKRLLFVKPVAWRPAQGEKPSGHKKRAGLVGLRGKRGRRTSDPVGWVDLMHLVDCTTEPRPHKEKNHGDHYFQFSQFIHTPGHLTALVLDWR
ncbi:unnamed protein product [Fusarium graminearum]|uniref:Chromosome 3, complete genome n=1 Tax=Gibberella zeae (strain ATCC MYA-4620 / CBS 123657 / FGSC 9075 / NRRL 31084 / PH-1) TaxID=229533 RepID=I1RMC9_GIBZE|nr:hypothetical protein FGSG_05118 [Fusarium graminearum PH-1]ESU11039.1 hypothetical protein FGSG_05118 [Fusarium graminearum PH-1]EYB31867.1 hypothetical protein FG05_05118 [Fusarium graminearum]CEF87296.1 unnamed protein product [Fusarium graminearum]CZS83683.1 unnamed protein product [Fusarium graminearum]|eukprot:XP_011323615.1 hypothetical protein FGSG_05118 [Fusarium graminearum PH-1]